MSETTAPLDMKAREQNRIEENEKLEEATIQLMQHYRDSYLIVFFYESGVRGM